MNNKELPRPQEIRINANHFSRQLKLVPTKSKNGIVIGIVEGPLYLNPSSINDLRLKWETIGSYENYIEEDEELKLISLSLNLKNERLRLQIYDSENSERVYGTLKERRNLFNKWNPITLQNVSLVKKVIEN